MHYECEQGQNFVVSYEDNQSLKCPYYDHLQVSRSARTHHLPLNNVCLCWPGNDIYENGITEYIKKWQSLVMFDSVTCVES